MTKSIKPLPPERHLPLKAVDFQVLLALLRGERHGYGLVKDIEEQSRGKVSLLPGNLYAVLRRLMREGLLEEAGRRRPRESEGPPRRYYRITELGRRTAAAEARRLRRLVHAAESARLIEKEGAP